MSNELQAVVVKDLYKSFKLPHEQHSDIKQLIVNFRKREKGYEVQKVLDRISFEISEGDFFGIVGRNGSGKSTLLKILAGIYAPDKGLVQVNGSLTPFIELGVGFNPELTGRENVFLNGALLGFSRSEMEAMYDDIVEFAELGRFMDQKLKNYSSGMQVRLAFSIAIRADGDILLLDEVLAVGDEAFQKKCFDYFDTLKKANKTVILVTHSMDNVKRFCNKAMLLSQGKIEIVGDPDTVSESYLKLNAPQDQTVVHEDKTADLQIEYENHYPVGEHMDIKMSWSDSRISALGVVVYKASGERIFATNTENDKFKINGTECVYRIKLDVAPGDYFLRIRAYSDDAKTSIGLIEQTPFFTVTAKEGEGIDGLVPLEHNWRSK